MTILYLCEKPSQARDIARILTATTRHDHYLEGKMIKVTWCVGHLLEAAPPDYYRPDLKPWRLEKLPIIPDKWHYQVVEKTKAQFKAIKALLKETNHVVIATDPDRAGEVIAREILDYCHYKGKIERLWLSALDETSIKNALTKLKSDGDTINLYDAGLGRAMADWIIGMNMSMATSCLYGVRGEGVLSVGRVQTPTLKLVVDRDREIENFRPQPYFVLAAQFSTNNHENFWTKWQVPMDEADEEGRCLNKTTISSIAEKIKNTAGIITDFKESKKEKEPPLCLSLSVLQKKASSLWGLSAKKVLDIAQSLYEIHKATTYPRTDCGYLPESQFNDARAVLNALIKIDPSLEALIQQCDTSFQSPVWNDKKITAHHAMIPTMNGSVHLDSMSDDERKIYDLIRRHYLAQFLGNYQYSNRAVSVLCALETFKASSNTPLHAGWKNALQTMEEENQEVEELILIPFLTKDQVVLNTKTSLENKQTKAPAHFSEGTLIEAMKNVGRYVTDPHLKKVLKETAGIGTEATRANILETLMKRDYLMRQTKQLRATKKGCELIDVLPSIVKDPATTAQWEQELEAIAEGKQKLETFLTQQTQVLQVMLQTLSDEKKDMPGSPLSVSQMTYPCPDCGRFLCKIKSKITSGYFWGCSNFPDCKVSLPDLKGEPGKSKPLIEQPEKTIKCPLCQTGKLYKRSGKKGFFWGCSRYPTCKHTCPDQKGEPMIKDTQVA